MAARLTRVGGQVNGSVRHAKAGIIHSMSVTIKVMSNDTAVRTHREALARRVESVFASQLPKSSLLCFFDHTDWRPFKLEQGEANRGIYVAIEHKEPPWLDWPPYVVDCVIVAEPSPVWHRRIFDHVIYLHGGTCERDTSLVMTFAHELQHFVQYETAPALWAESRVVANLTKDDIRILKLNSFDIPIEQEARRVSKRVAEKLFGAEIVRGYINDRINKNVSSADVDDWKFIQQLDLSITYDLKTETRLLYQRLKNYRPQLEETLRLCKKELRDPAFDFVDLNGLLDRTT